MRDGAARWATREPEDAELERAAALFGDGLSVRDVADEMNISKSKAQRLRQRAVTEGRLDE
jgi:DNA-binding transcriptional regulator LsrR (DeoR family)